MRSLYDGIQRFLDDVDPVIFSRGQEYYRHKYVESIDYDEGHVTAEVSGSEYEPYLVEIDFDEYGEVEAWECDCPYEWGPVCKHTVAALLAIQAESPEKIPQKEHAEKVSVRDLVERAEKAQLAELILEYCRVDKRFRNHVLSALEDSGEQEFAAIKELVKDSIRSNTRHGYIDEDGCDNICADLDDALEKAHSRIERGQYDRALDIAQFVLITGIRLMEADTGSLSSAVDAALETVGLAAKGLAESGGERSEWVRKLLETAQDPVFDDWDDWQFDFLGRITVLADAQSEDEFKRVLLLLDNKRWENFKDGGRRLDQDCYIRYQIVRAVHGQAAGREYLEKNVTLDMFRLMLVQEYMEEGNYAGAERLCLERLAGIEMAPRCVSNQWDHLLYDIYQKWEQRTKQIAQARKLTLLRDTKFYGITKELLMEDGQWQKEYPVFLAELKDALSTNQYMEILAEEGETALLMEQVRVNQDTVFQYGGILACRYGEEICGMCSAAIRRFSKQIGNRKDYQRLCGFLRSLVKFGGTSEAQTLIHELRQTYPRRRALLEELDQVEREAGKR